MYDAVTSFRGLNNVSDAMRLGMASLVKADKALAEFTRVFGLRPDADYRRFTQANRPNCNKAVW